MIYDCFCFFNELPMLDLRLNTLNPYVDKFVLVEATRTQSNKPKELFYQSNKELFKNFEDKIIHVVLDEYPEHLEQWTIENLQRNTIAKGLTQCSDDDVIIISDLDEIPRPELIEKYKSEASSKIIAFDLKVYNYFLNLHSVNQPWIRGSKMLSYNLFKTIFNKTDYFEKYPAGLDMAVNQGTSATKIRMYNGKNQIHIKNAGWHFSYIGGKSAVISKYKSTCEGIADFDEKDYRKKINYSRFLNRWKLTPVKIDDEFPQYLVENQEKYRDFIITKDEQKALIKEQNYTSREKFDFFIQHIIIVLKIDKIKKVIKKIADKHIKGV